MIQLGDDDLVPRTPPAPESAGQVKRQRSHVGAERDLVRGPVQEVGSGGAGVGEELVGFLAGGVVPVRVRVVAKKVLADRVYHFARDLGASGPIEVGDRVAAVLPL